MQKFLKALFIALTLLSGLNLWADDTPFSYGQMAQTIVASKYQEVLSELEILTEDVAPQETKKLRKLVGASKQLLDIFIFAYPLTDKIDQLDLIRDDLDNGYDVIGNFKDLYDTAGDRGMNEEEVKRLRLEVLKWKSHFLILSQQRNDYGYLMSPLLDQFQDRPLKKLPKYYWSKVSLRPSMEQSAYQILRQLCVEVMSNALNDYNKLLDFDHIFTPEREEVFHDFRKQVRAVLNLDNLIPEFFTFSETQSVSFRFMQEIVERWGNLHDVMIAYELAKKVPDEARAMELKEQIDLEWKQLLAWSMQQNLVVQVHNFQQLLQRSSPF